MILHSTFRISVYNFHMFSISHEAVGNVANVCDLITRTEVEIPDLDETTEAEQEKEAFKRHFWESIIGETKFSLTKKA